MGAWTGDLFSRSSDFNKIYDESLNSKETRMETVKRILFPVDMSGVSSMVVSEVIDMAHKFNAEIHLLYVAVTLERYDTFYVPHPSLDRFEVDLHKTGEQRLLEFEQEHFNNYPHTRRVVMDGNPAEAILRYIASEDIDMVIMGTHGRKGVDRMLFGSVAEQVVKDSSVPVLSINPYLRKVEGPAAAAVRTQAPPSQSKTDCLNCSGPVDKCMDACAM
jgi:nucleotide-binding universal stress UspA family protein